MSDTSILSRLLDIEPTKTWSLIVTVFGDLEADQISGKDLKALLEPLRVKPEAMRVALYRLKKDGWIVSEKIGREVAYRLSDHARRETNAAREDVYRRGVKYPGAWRFVLLEPETPPPAEPSIVIERSLWLIPPNSPLPKDAIALAPSESFPPWFEERLVTNHTLEIARQLTDLAEQFGEVEAHSDDITSARIMFLHYWRKMALRPGTWAHIGMVPDGAMARCHRSVVQVLDRTNRTHPAKSGPASALVRPRHPKSVT